MLDIDYIPERLPHREKQLMELMNIFGSLLQSGREARKAPKVLVLGDIGTGKTVTTKRFGQIITAEAQRRGVKLYYVHINCRKQRGSFFNILLTAIKKVNPKYPSRGFAAQELTDALMDALDQEDALMILTLDDAEALLEIQDKKRKTDPFYSLSRAHDDRLGPVRLALICILRDPSKLDALDEATKSTLMEYVIKMPRYTKEQLMDILADRVRLAFFEDVVRDEVVEFIAEVAAGRGDARYAIDLLWRAGKLAEQEGSPEVLPQHVRKAIASGVLPLIRKDVLEALPLHAKLLLLAIARTFKHTDEAYVPMGDAEETYRMVCEEFKQKPRKHTQVWKYMKELSQLNIISAVPSGPGVRGRTTLISLPIPAEALEKALLEYLEKELEPGVDGGNGPR